MIITIENGQKKVKLWVNRKILSTNFFHSASQSAASQWQRNRTKFICNNNCSFGTETENQKNRIACLAKTHYKVHIDRQTDGRRGEQRPLFIFCWIVFMAPFDDDETEWSVSVSFKSITKSSSIQRRLCWLRLWLCLRENVNMSNEISSLDLVVGITHTQKLFICYMCDSWRKKSLAWIEFRKKFSAQNWWTLNLK